MNTVNVAVIGAGIMGSNHARVYSDLSHANLTAVCDANNEIAKKIADRYKISCYIDYKEMLQKEKIDAVSVCVPTKIHKEVAVYCIKKNIHVLIEKPIAATIKDAHEIINEAGNHNAKLMVGHIEIFNPVIAELKKRIDSNELGKIFKVHCVRQSLFPKRVIDIGVIIDLAIHEIYILKYLIGSDIKRIYAETAQRVHSGHEDLLIGMLRFQNDILGVINANWLTPKKIREITVTGEKGMLVANYLTQELYFYEREYVKGAVDFSNIGNPMEGKKTRIDIKTTEPLLNELTSFVECIQENKEPKVSGKAGLDALFVAQKFLESAKNNKVVNV